MGGMETIQITYEDLKDFYDVFGYLPVGMRRISMKDTNSLRDGDNEQEEK